MVEVRWTLQAIEDINGIAEFIARDSERYAEMQVMRFFAEEDGISSNPLAGRMVSEMADRRIREVIVGNYRIIYEIIGEQRVDVLTVHHSNRLLSNNPNIVTKL